MKHSMKILAVVMAAVGTIGFHAFYVPVAGFAAQPAVGQAPGFQLTLRPESKVWLTGDSTLHPFGSTATVVNLKADFQPAGAGPWATVAEELNSSEAMAFVVTIPVEGLKSGEKGLDKNLYKAMKAAEFPSIEFRLSDKKLLAGAPVTGSGHFTSNGTLTIAGKENKIQMDFQAEPAPDGIHIFGTQQLLMTDYGIKPPTMLGMIKTKNEVVIHFDLILDRRVAAP